MTTPTTTTSAALRLRSGFQQPSQFNIPGATPFNNEKKILQNMTAPLSHSSWYSTVFQATHTHCESLHTVSPCTVLNLNLQRKNPDQ